MPQLPAEPVLRAVVFAGVFLCLGAAELLVPKRHGGHERKQRWAANLGLFLVDILVQRATVGAVVFGAGLYAEAHDIGLMRLAELPPPVAALLGFAALDFAVWLQHVVSHRWPFLWRLHQVHHADVEMDLTTGLRFHPGEIILSALFKAVVVLGLGSGLGPRCCSRPS